MWGAAPTKHKTKTKFQVASNSTNTLIIDLQFDQGVHLNEHAPNSFTVKVGNSNSNSSVMQVVKQSTVDEMKQNNKIQVEFSVNASDDDLKNEKLIVELNLYICAGDACSTKNVTVSVPVTGGSESGVSKTEVLNISL